MFEQRKNTAFISAMVILSFEVSHDSVTDILVSVSKHSKHQNVVVDYSMADLTSMEYEQDLHRNLHSRCWKFWLTQLQFLTRFRSENGPEKLISHVLLQSSFWILFRVMYMLFADHLFWWWFCIATLRLWPIKWQLKHSESLYLHFSGVWLANPEHK